MMASAGDTLPIPCDAAAKAALRREARRRRIAIPPHQRKRAAERAARVVARALPRRASVAVYLSIASELPTAPLIAALRRDGHRLYAPLTLPGARLRFVPLRAAAALRRRGAARLREPCATRPRLAARALDAIVLPLLAFDAAGTRLGNGGGYYDRTLAGLHGGGRPWLLGFAYAAQEMAALPREPWDVTLDAVATERGLRRFH